MGMDFMDRLDELIEKTPGVGSRKALAAKVGISVAAIAAWKARGNFPTAQVAVAIARELNTTVEFLILGESPSVDPWLIENYDVLAMLKAAGQNGVDVMAVAQAVYEISQGGPSVIRISRDDVRAPVDLNSIYQTLNPAYVSPYPQDYVSKMLGDIKVLNGVRGREYVIRPKQK